MSAPPLPPLPMSLLDPSVPLPPTGRAAGGRGKGRGWSRGCSCTLEGGDGAEEIAGVEEVIGAEGVPASACGSRRMGAEVVGPTGMDLVGGFECLHKIRVRSRGPTRVEFFI
jgi:hypothetical protein